MSESETRCRYCGDEPEPDCGDTCDWCFYGMRFDPDGWRARLAALGRPVHYVGGCLHARMADGMALVCRNPYEPGDGQ